MFKQARAAQNGALPRDLSLIFKARGLKSTAPWYTHWFWMLVDIARGYQEGGADGSILPNWQRPSS